MMMTFNKILLWHSRHPTRNKITTSPMKHKISHDWIIKIITALNIERKHIIHLDYLIKTRNIFFNEKWANIDQFQTVLLAYFQKKFARIIYIFNLISNDTISRVTWQLKRYKCEQHPLHTVGMYQMHKCMNKYIYLFTTFYYNFIPFL